MSQVENGFFFPQRSLSQNEERDQAVLQVSTVIEYVFGRPGIVVTRCDGEIRYIPGVLVGKVNKVGKSVKLV
jgi:hypothetical protein